MEDERRGTLGKELLWNKREEWKMGRDGSWSQGRKGKAGRLLVRREAWMGYGIVP